MTIDLLSKIYNQWGKKNNIYPLYSADEELIGNSKLTTKQQLWLERFIDVWNKLEDRS